MEMWLKQLILMLFTVAVTAMVISGQAAVRLDDQQKREEVPSGSNLSLICCLNTEKYERYRINWYFNKSGSSFSKSIKICEKIINKNANVSKDEPENSETCILPNVNESHSGWYSCNITVEIPNLTEIHSNGTEVFVLDSEVTTFPSNVTNIKDIGDPSGNWWIWILMGVSSFILLVMTVICAFTRRQENRADEPIYANTRYPNKQPSPRPDMSGAAVSLKTASSSQNLRTPSPARYDEGKRRYKH